MIRTEVLQGFADERDFHEAGKMLRSLMVIELCGREIAIQAAINFRTLRKLGVTVRKTIDTVIATRCIESGYYLLHDDRDFEPFAKSCPWHEPPPTRFGTVNAVNSGFPWRFDALAHVPWL